MNKRIAANAVGELGEAYFYGTNRMVSTEDAMAEICQQIRGVKTLRVLRDWENWLEGLETVLSECTSAELDRLVEDDYRRFPEEVGGGRAFLEQIDRQLYREVAEARRRLAWRRSLACIRVSGGVLPLAHRRGFK